MLLNSYIILMKKYGIIWLKTRRQKCILFFYPYIFMKSFPMIYPCFFEQPASNH